MAEGVVSNVTAKILELLARQAYQQGVSCWRARGDLDKLKETLEFIQAHIQDAETRREDDNSGAIKKCLGSLRQVLYRADDLFDEVNTLSRRQQRDNRSTLVSRVRTIFSSSNSIILSTKIAQEIKSTRKTLDEIKSDMVSFKLSARLPHEEPLSRLGTIRDTGFYVKADNVIGRENDKVKIFDMLFDPKYAEHDVSVIPIVGFGGLGKTTLAQMVFNDERVQKHFDIAKWACVSEINNPKKVIGKTLTAFTGASYSNLEKEQIESQLREAVKDKRFFLVLDDIWDHDRDRWQGLFTLLQCSNRGSKIVVTTRSDEVASNVGTVPKAYKLGLLTHEESWKLFKKVAFKEGQEESNPNFTQIGKGIVKNCGNVPLAIKVVGSLLYSKTEKEWEILRNTQFSKPKLIDNGNIMPVLKLSYDYLPSYLKPCFAYCSLFPKDHEFENTELVHLWMAQGYVKPLQENLGMEDAGELYFLELLRRNFFQDVMEDDFGNVISFKMHDLMHDLAQRVAGQETLVLEGSRVQLTNRLVHLNVCSSEESREDLRSLLDAKTLRSLLLNNSDYQKIPSLEKLILGSGSLRALQSDFIEVIPDSIGRLIHLRYLNFSDSDIRYLPSGITRLDNLQTLKINHCRELQELPRGFTKLANLRHLGINDCPFTEMPQNFGSMKSLQEVNRFIIGQNNGLDALSDLNLRGGLEIVCRRRRTNDVDEAKRANLKEKTQLASLSLCFEYQGEQAALVTRDEELLLESLQLPTSLKHLYFSGLRGSSFSRWMLKDLAKLVKIEIKECHSCRVLPFFSQLPLLRCLYLEELSAVEYVEEADGVSASSTYFPALECLTLNSMRKLKSWAKLGDKDKCQLRYFYVFPRLRILEMSFCVKLTTFPTMPNIESMIVCEIQEELLESFLTSNQTAPSSSSSSSSSTPTLKYLDMRKIKLTSVNLRSACLIKKLTIRECGSLRNTSNVIRCFSVLEELEICQCEDFDDWEGFKSLLTLRLTGMPRVESLPDWITSLTTLQDLLILDLENLTVLPQKIGNLSKLHNLSVVSCPKLTSLPQSFSALTCLETLVIRRCPELKKRCEEPDGQDLPLIQHIPKVSLSR